jgi:hypothetical protein
MPLEILVLTEDTGAESVATFRKLLPRLVSLYDDRGQLVVDIRPGDKDAFPRVGSNLWRAKNERSYEELTKLCKAIANRLAQGDVVLFHTDADATWSTRDGRLAREFDEKIRQPTGRWLSDTEARQRRPTGWAATRLERLIHVVPTWSIEAWTYQATGKAKELCRTQYGGRDVAKFDAWESDRTLLDEVEKPKDNVCLKNKHNTELAAEVPAPEVVASGKSLARFVSQLRALSELAERMRIWLG